jgi:hypothetical protein
MTMARTPRIRAVSALNKQNDYARRSRYRMRPDSTALDRYSGRCRDESVARWNMYRCKTDRLKHNRMTDAIELSYIDRVCC